MRHHVPTSTLIRDKWGHLIVYSINRSFDATCVKFLYIYLDTPALINPQLKMTEDPHLTIAMGKTPPCIDLKKLETAT